MSNDKVTLYHFTNEEALTDILLDGEIRPSGKSLDREGDDIWPAHNAPDIVWMTTDPTPGWCCERFRSGTRPYEVRFTLRLPAHEVNDLWTWATHHKVYPDSAELRPSSADEGSRFRCIERPVLVLAHEGADRCRGEVVGTTRWPHPGNQPPPHKPLPRSAARRSPVSASGGVFDRDVLSSGQVHRETRSPTSEIASPLGVGGSEISGGESRETGQSCAFSLRSDESPESGWSR